MNNHGSEVSEVAKDKGHRGDRGDTGSTVTDTVTNVVTNTVNVVTNTVNVVTNTVDVFESTTDIVFPPSLGDGDYVLGSDLFLHVEEGFISTTTYTEFGSETFGYQETETPGIFTREYELWTVFSPSPLEVVPHYQEKLVYVGSEGDDLIAVRANIDAVSGAGSDTFVVREGGNLVFTDFSAQDEIHVDTALGLTSVEHLLSLITSQYWESGNYVVEFGDAATVVFEALEVGILGVNDVFVYS